MNFRAKILKIDQCVAIGFCTFVLISHFRFGFLQCSCSRGHRRRSNTVVGEKKTKEQVICVQSCCNGSRQEKERTEEPDLLNGLYKACWLRENRSSDILPKKNEMFRSSNWQICSLDGTTCISTKQTRVKNIRVVE